MKFRASLLAAALISGSLGVAIAAGTYTNGLPVVGQPASGTGPGNVSSGGQQPVPPGPTVPAGPAALTGTEVIPADTNAVAGTAPQTIGIPVSALRNTSGMSQQTPLTAFAITIPANVAVLQLTPAGTLATGTITLPASPYDGQDAFIFSTQTVTALTIAANMGQTINGTAITTIAANTRIGYKYNVANTTWYREQ